MQAVDATSRTTEGEPGHSILQTNVLDWGTHRGGGSRQALAEKEVGVDVPSLTTGYLDPFFCSICLSVLEEPLGRS